uniref:ORF58h n=1 Tax=Pinus koraiensis TaxID=88728 RepID=A4QMC9_PINKO|nr:ORF58h [Pinus koraiensis]
MINLGMGTISLSIGRNWNTKAFDYPGNPYLQILFVRLFRALNHREEEKLNLFRNGFIH